MEQCRKPLENLSCEGPDQVGTVWATLDIPVCSHTAPRAPASAALTDAHRDRPARVALINAHRDRPTRVALINARSDCRTGKTNQLHLQSKCYDEFRKEPSRFSYDCLDV